MEFGVGLELVILGVLAGERRKGLEGGKEWGRMPSQEEGRICIIQPPLFSHEMEMCYHEKLKMCFSISQKKKRVVLVYFDDEIVTNFLSRLHVMRIEMHPNAMYEWMLVFDNMDNPKLPGIKDTGV